MEEYLNYLQELIASTENNLGSLMPLIANSINAEVLGNRNGCYDIAVISNLMAAIDSANYFNEHMSTAKNFNDAYELLSHAMSIRNSDGLIIEFGVATGSTIDHISKLTNGKVYGFDSFSGLPEDWRTGFEKGSFAQKNLPQLNPNVELIVGLFEDTLPEFVEYIGSQNISFIHVDCDLYSSTKTIFDFLGKNVVPGTVIVFDEYFNYSGWRKHEFKAFHEYCEQNRINYRYDSFVSSHQQTCVIIEDKQ